MFFLGWLFSQEHASTKRPLQAERHMGLECFISFFFLSAMVDLIDHRSKWLSVSHKLAAFQGLSSTGVKDKWLKPALSNLIKKTTCTPFAPQVFDKFLTIERRFVPGCFCVPKRFVLGPVWLRQKRQFLEKRHPWFCYYKLHAKKQNVCNVGAVEIQKVLWILEQFPVVSISWTGTHGRQLKLYRETTCVKPWIRIIRVDVGLICGRHTSLNCEFQ